MRFFDIENIDEIDFTALMRMLPGRQMWNPFSTQGRYIAAMLRSQKTLERYGVNSAIRLAHFIGQGLIETGFLRYRGENLNYSADRLMDVFPKYFRDRAEAEGYHRKPERIANRVYANRMGNGDEASGDGWRYRGRGFFQLTGKNNYRRYGELSGIDLVRNPDILEKDLKKSIEVAAAFFGKTGLGEYADRNDIPAVSRGINLGNPNSSRPAHSESERIVWTERALDLVVDPQQIVRGPGEAPAGDEVLDVGDTGEAVRALQRNLDTLGYSVGAIDGIFGRNTRRAVLAFQDESGLPANGVVDAATADAIDEALNDPRRFRNLERAEATASDLRRGGAGDVAKTGQAGNAGAAAGGAGAVAAANETGVIDEAVEAARGAVAGDDGSGGDEIGGDESAAPTDAAPTDAAPTDGAPRTGDAPDADAPAVPGPEIDDPGADDPGADDPEADEAADAIAAPFDCAPAGPEADGREPGTADGAPPFDDDVAGDGDGDAPAARTPDEPTLPPCPADAGADAGAGAEAGVEPEASPEDAPETSATEPTDDRVEEPAGEPLEGPEQAPPQDDPGAAAAPDATPEDDQPADVPGEPVAEASEPEATAADDGTDDAALEEAETDEPTAEQPEMGDGRGEEAPEQAPAREEEGVAPPVTPPVAPPLEPSAPPSLEETTREIREEDGGFSFPKIGDEDTNWGTVAILLGIAVTGAFVYARSRQAIRDRVEDYRRH